MSNSKPKLVSIVIATYNGARFLGEAIDSALAQDYKPIEIIVIDDGSTDDTPHLLSAYGDKVTVHRQPNAGVSAARNKGFELARGEVIVLLDSDDVLLPSCVSSRVALLEREPNVGFVTGLTRYIDEQGNPIEGAVDLKPEYPNGISYLDAMRRFPGPPSGWAIPKAVILESGGFDPTIRAAEDHDLCLRILVNHKGICDPEIRVLYREVAGSLGKNDFRNYDETRRVIRKHKRLAPVGAFAFWWNSRVMLLTSAAGAFTRILQGPSPFQRLVEFLAQRPSAIPFFGAWIARAAYNRLLYMFNMGPLRAKERALRRQAEL